MENYKRYLNDPDINRILDTVNTMYKDIFTVCHGRQHTLFVVDIVETLLKSLDYDERTIELGKIAALMHDIGNIAGRWEHAKKSAALAKVFLDGSDPPFSVDEKQMVLQAIEDHSDGANISSPIGAAVLFADKVYGTKKRLLPNAHLVPFYMNMTEIRKAKSDNEMEIEDANVYVSGKDIIVNLITSDTFNKKLFLSGWDIPLKLKRAAEYLSCTCRFQINGEEVRITNIEVITLSEEIKVIGLSFHKLGLPETIESIENMWKTYNEKYRNRIENAVVPVVDYAVNANLLTDTHEYIAGCTVAEVGELDENWASFVIPSGRYIKHTSCITSELHSTDMEAWAKTNGVVINKDFLVEVYPGGVFNEGSLNYVLHPIQSE